ncbi:MAG: sugar nucleotide-binding protein [Desulfobacterales bacterium]|nr:sugar nucleotide-binding protein [Desulfobacterales bacterium]
MNEKRDFKSCLMRKNMDIRIIYISTDYVFDGKNKPYLPTDRQTWINNYGISKLKGRRSYSKNCDKYYIASTSWLYGHKGKNFVETMIALANNNKEIKAVNDQIGCPT